MATPFLYFIIAVSAIQIVLGVIRIEELFTGEVVLAWFKHRQIRIPAVIWAIAWTILLLVALYHTNLPGIIRPQ